MGRKTTIGDTGINLAWPLYLQLFLKKIRAGVYGCTSAAVTRFAVAQVTKGWLSGCDYPKRSAMALVQNYRFGLGQHHGGAYRASPRSPDDRCPTRSMNRAVTRSLGRDTRSATGRRVPS